MTDKEQPSTRQVIRATRPYWLIPIVLIFGLALVLALLDIAPLRNFAYTVF